MPHFLAIDAGGTSTRAVLIDSTGRCLGYGTAGGGNPVSRGVEGAVAALTAAATQALGGGETELSGVVLAMAGASVNLPRESLHDPFVTLGLVGHVMIESDLLAGFYSGSHQDEGYALVAGTGAVAARITNGRLGAVIDGTGWLLGDEGSGFWLGQQVVRAVAAALDGRGAPTALTAFVLAELGIAAAPGERVDGRIRAQQQLIEKIYALAPIELSRFAPGVFAVPTDAVAAQIIDRCGAALTRTLTAALEPGLAGPLVFGGSVLTKGDTIAAAVLAGVAGQWPPGAPQPTAALVLDGVVGAAVLALKRHGITVDEAAFVRVSSSLATLRG